MSTPVELMGARPSSHSPYRAFLLAEQDALAGALKPLAESTALEQSAAILEIVELIEARLSAIACELPPTLWHLRPPAPEGGM